jgi:hypothetical protein
MRFIFSFLFFATMLFGCAENTPVFIDCGNGYQVRPPLACPEIGAKF